jgi:hypothetical protein
MDLTSRTPKRVSKDIEINENFVDHIMPEVKKLLEIEKDFRIKVKEFDILQVNIVLNLLIKYSYENTYFMGLLFNSKLDTNVFE